MSKWDLKSIQSYIDNQVEENLNLDFKAAEALQKTDGRKKDIIKDVSAMANAAGGTIIYGIKEFVDSSKQHLPERIDPVNRTEISKEWLEQVISNIQPRIEGIIITPITVDETNNTVLYVVQIPQSTTAHQATDKKYYKRYNFESIAMDDYEIRDIMSRIKNPIMTLELSLEATGETNEKGVGFSLLKKLESWTSYTLNIAIRNNGKVLANYVNYYLELPEDILHNDHLLLHDSTEHKGYKVFYAENTIRDVLDVQNTIRGFIEKYGPSRYNPILPGTRSRYECVKLADNNNKWDRELFWTIYADNADPQKGSIKLERLLSAMTH